MIALVKHKLYLALAGFLMKFAPPSGHMLFAGSGSSAQLGLHMARNGLRKVLVVTDKPLVELGICERACDGLVEAGPRT